MSTEPMLLMLVLFVLLPVMLLLCFALPLYAGLYISLMQIYEPHPPAAPSEVVQVVQLYHQCWHILLSEPVSVQSFLPLIWPPAIGLGVGCYLFYRGCRWIRGIFTVDDLK